MRLSMMMSPTMATETWCKWESAARRSAKLMRSTCMSVSNFSSPILGGSFSMTALEESTKSPRRTTCSPHNLQRSLAPEWSEGGSASLYSKPLTKTSG